MSYKAYFYNGANRKKRAEYIQDEDRSLSQEIALEYAKLNYEPLIQFRNIGNAAFDSVATTTPDFQNVRERFEKLAKTSPKAVEELVLLYNELGPEKYGAVLGSFADNVAADKDFGEKMVSGLERNPELLRTTFKSYAEAKENRTLDSYIENVKGIRAATAPPPPSTAPAAPPSSTAPAATPSVALPNTSGMSDEQIEALLSDPKYTGIVNKLKASGQYDRLVAGVKGNNKVLDQFADPGTRKQMAALVQSGDMEGFFKKLNGVQIQAASGPVKFGDIMNQAKEGLMGMLGSLGDLFGGAGEGLQKIMALFGNFQSGSPAARAEKASIETGQQIAALLDSTNPADKEYGNRLLQGAIGAAATLDVPHGAHQRAVLMGAGLNTKMIEDAAEGRMIRLKHVQIKTGPNGVKSVSGEPVMYVRPDIQQVAAVPYQVQIAQNSANEPNKDGVAPPRPVVPLPDGTFG